MMEGAVYAAAMATLMVIAAVGAVGLLIGVAIGWVAF